MKDRAAETSGTAARGLPPARHDSNWLGSRDKKAIQSPGSNTEGIGIVPIPRFTPKRAPLHSLYLYPSSLCVNVKLIALMSSTLGGVAYMFRSWLISTSLLKA